MAVRKWRANGREETPTPSAGIHAVSGGRRSPAPEFQNLRRPEQVARTCSPRSAVRMPQSRRPTKQVCATCFIEQHGEDFERRITPHWIGQVIRRKLQLKTERRREGYVIAASEGPKLARLLEKYGMASDSVNFVNSVNSQGDTEAPPAGPEPLII